MQTKIEKIISKLVWAVNLYSQAGDPSNTRRQYLEKAEEARSLIMNDVQNDLRSLEQALQDKAEEFPDIEEGDK